MAMTTRLIQLRTGLSVYLSHTSDLLSEESVSDITPICSAAEKYAPEYNVDAIYDELQSRDNS